MLSRTFRLTDKLTNALLRLVAWGLAAAVEQLYDWRLAINGLLLALTTMLTRTARTGQTVYRSTDQRQQALMARQAAFEERLAVTEDPLRTQNRALSLFTVVLLSALILFVLVFTSGATLSSGAPPPGRLPTLIPTITQTVIAALATNIPTSAPIAAPVVSGSIIYSAHQRGYDNLWVVGIGQSAPIRLTNGAYDDRDPAWSHDGTQVAFVTHRDGNWELYVLSIASGATRRLTYTLGYKAHPSWSPDDKFIAYEFYDKNNLDIWIASVDGSQEPRQLTQNAAPDFAPSWSPGGRDIAYVSLREGSQQIYVLNLDHLGNPQDSTAQRLTNAPNVECDSPVWSPDGKQIAYSGRDTSTGLQLVYVTGYATPSAAPTVVGPGRDPAWSPTGQSLLSAVDGASTTTLIASQVGPYGVAATTIALDLRTGRPDWTPAALPPALLQNPPPRDPVVPPLFDPFSDTPTPGNYDKLAVILPDTPDALLSQRVADSFLKLRQAVRASTGLDFLGSQLSLWWAIQGTNRHLPDPGQSLRNWHYAGRAFDFERNLVYSSSDQPSPVEIVREDNADGQTYWRVYIRVAESLQTGALGEPLKALPWDLASRSSAQDPQAYQDGGRLKPTVPSGYYVDFTALAADYGWTRLPADRQWRALATGLRYWEFDQRDNLSWDQAMQQLYPPDQVAAFLNGPTPVPTPRGLPTSAVTRTPTPIPPDQIGK